MGIKCRNEQGCAVCEKVAPNQCPGCEVKYCSRECQKKDWKQHKKTCFNLLKKTMSMPEPDAEPIEQPPEELTKMTVGDLKRKSRSLGATEYQVTSSAPNPHLVLTQSSPHLNFLTQSPPNPHHPHPTLTSSCHRSVQLTTTMTSNGPPLS